MLLGHCAESLNCFLEHINTDHPTVKFTAAYSYDIINYLNLKASRSGGKLETDYVKFTNTHQYLQKPILSIQLIKKTSILYSQALRPNGIKSRVSLLSIEISLNLLINLLRIYIFSYAKWDFQEPQDLDNWNKSLSWRIDFVEFWLIEKCAIFKKLLVWSTLNFY